MNADELNMYRQSLLTLTAEVQTISTIIPDSAYYFQPNSNAYMMLSWVDRVTEAELKHGVVPTFLSEWSRQFSEPIVNKSAGFNDYYQLALCHLIAGDSEAYRNVCREMVAKFEHSTNGASLQFAGWTCALSPDALADYSLAIELEQRSGELEKSPTFYLGALFYRSGEFERARDQLLEVKDADAPSWSPAYVWYFLAMSEFRLGNFDQAKDWFQKATELTTAQLADEQAGKQSLAWNRRATLRLLDAETRALLTEQLP